MEAMQSSSNTPCQEHSSTLLHLARHSIEHGLETGTPAPVTLEQFHRDLQQPGAAFVTLHKGRQLRGCIGNLEAHQPLVRDVAANAFKAAFRDPRFAAVEIEELAALQVEISVLTPYEAISSESEAELLAQLRPHVDGLLLEEGSFRGTFLPAVWEQLPDKEQFLQQLKQKAGLPTDYWSQSLKIFRYRTVCYTE